MFTVYNVGMIYFDGCNVGQKRALVPDGREGDATTDPPTPRHYASIFVGADKVDLDKTHWWWGAKYEREVTFLDDDHQAHTVKAYEFRIKEPSEIAFPDKRNGEPAEFKDLEKLPRLQSDRHFQLAEDPKTIARVALRSGLLQAGTLSEVPIVSWKVTEHADPIKITARDDEGNLFYISLKDQQTMYDEKIPYRDDITMVLSNTPDFIALMEITPGHDHGDPPPPVDLKVNGKATRKTNGKANGTANGKADRRATDKHFEHGGIYGKLNKDEKRVTLADTRPDDLKPVQLKQGYLQFLAASHRYRQSDCSPTCCDATPGSGGGGH